MSCARTELQGDGDAGPGELGYSNRCLGSYEKEVEAATCYARCMDAARPLSSKSDSELRQMLSSSHPNANLDSLDRKWLVYHVGTDTMENEKKRYQDELKAEREREAREASDAEASATAEKARRLAALEDQLAAQQRQAAQTEAEIQRLRDERNRHVLICTADYPDLKVQQELSRLTKQLQDSGISVRTCASWDASEARTASNPILCGRTTVCKCHRSTPPTPQR